MTLASLPLRVGAAGPDVSELRRRLSALGHDTSADPVGHFGPATASAVSSFQQSRGLEVTGTCDPSTWGALIETEHDFGTRMLCLRSPMMRGEDIAELQLRLGTLGFDSGRVDGIFGPRTQRAVGEFQRNAGLICDEVCGPDTVEALHRLAGRAGSASVTSVRERVDLRRAAGDLGSMSIAVGALDDHGDLVAGLAASMMGDAGALTIVEGDESQQAAATNEFGADLYLGIVTSGEVALEAVYFAVTGFESIGGRALAETVVREFPASPGWGIGVVHGMRLPILRETRAPAVVVRIGDPDTLRSQRDLVIAALHRAVSNWASNPLNSAEGVSL